MSDAIYAGLLPLDVSPISILFVDALIPPVFQVLLGALACYEKIYFFSLFNVLNLNEATILRATETKSQNHIKILQLPDFVKIYRTIMSNRLNGIVIIRKTLKPKMSSSVGYQR